ncbi:MAG: hypothetical protein QM811_15410 [Pirellulales bacterium]
MPITCAAINSTKNTTSKTACETVRSDSNPANKAMPSNSVVTLNCRFGRGAGDSSISVGKRVTRNLVARADGFARRLTPSK